MHNNAKYAQDNNGHKVLSGVLCLLAIFLLNNIFGSTAWSQANKNVHKMPTSTKITAKKPKTKINRITPQIPKANRHQKNKIFLEKADFLVANEMISTDYQILRGNVEFSKSGTRLYCDSAYFYDKTNSLDAFGHVKMNQGDTLFVYADLLYYNGQDEIAQLRRNVRLVNRDVTLYTDSLDYDMVENLGYYFEGGKIVDSKNELSSVYGQYEPDTKNAEFLFDVELVNDKYVLKTDTLHYNTNTHIADIVGTTTIVSDSNIIYSKKGWYNTDADNATLYNRSLVVGKNGQKLIGDTVYYDRAKGYGEAFGNMILTDSVHNSILDGDYGYHNEKTSQSFATKRARAREFSKGDTLYLHSDTIRTFLDKDSLRVLVANPRVRFYRVNIQGVCDSMSFEERDSMLNMYKHALVWSENRQISGNEINVHLNDSTVDYATLPNYGFMAEHIGEDYFNQLAGKEMKAYFLNDELRQLDVNGNVQLIMYPMENDSTYNKLVDAESSYMKILLKPKQEIDKITMWPEVSGNVTPLYIAKKSQYYLKDFGWYETLRPKDPDDIFNYPDEMDALMNSAKKQRRHTKKN